MPVGDARLVQIVGRHFDVDLVADADADEVFPHFAGDVREHLMPVRQGDAKHGARQHLLDVAGQLDWLFFGHDYGPESYANRSARNQSLSDPKSTPKKGIGHFPPTCLKSANHYEM